MSGSQTVRALDDDPRAYDPGVLPLGVLQSAGRHPYITALPIVLLLFAAIAYSLHRTPTYTAEARMTVAKLDLSQPGALNGFANATQALATAYSRSITAQEVIRKIAADTNLAPEDVRSRLSSTPIPDSPLFLINAKGSSAAQTMRVANSAAEALRDYVNRSAAGSNAVIKALLLTYKARRQQAGEALQAIEDAKRDVRDSPTAARRKAVSAAEATYSAARLQAQVAAEAYTRSASAGSSTQGADVLAPATFATNDRRTTTQIYAFVAVVIGAFLGAALATLIEHRRFRRVVRSSGGYR